MEHQHTRDAIRQRLAAGPRPSYSRDWVYGGIDGIVTTFAIIAGVTGGRLAHGILLILGSASVIADGFAMAAGNYLATRAEHDQRRYAEAIERRHLEVAPEGERDEVREILQGQLGVHDDLLDKMVAALTSNRERWLRVMLTHEYGLPDVVRSPWRAAGSTFWAFVLCGVIPLLPFAAGLSHAFMVGAALSGLTFVVIGALKSRWSIQRWWRSGLETLFIGGGAAVIAYAIGAWMRDLAG